MRRKSIYTIGVISLLFVLSSCASQTTDPHQGGLFSYNPAAYESRIQSRQKQLAQQKEENQSMRNKGALLGKEKTSAKREMAALNKKIASLSNSIASLEKKLRKAELETTENKTQKKVILKKLQNLQSSVKASDFIKSPKEKRAEIKRLKKEQDALEKEAAALMRL